MKQGPLAELLIERFDLMPRQLQMASRFVLDHPDDVAFMSMREQASRAGVSHSTMMRLARALGLKSYEDIRELYAKELRDPQRGFDSPVPAGVDYGEQSGFSRVGGIADTLAAQVASLGEFANAQQLLAAGEVIAGARRVFALGYQAEYAAAYHFANTLSLFGEDAVLLGAAGGTGVEALRNAESSDVILIIGLDPYARAAVETARRAADNGITVVAVTDSPVAPLARIAQETLIVTARSQSGFSSLVPAMASVEILAGLVADRRGVDVEDMLGRAKTQLSALEVYWKP